MTTRDLFFLAAPDPWVGFEDVHFRVMVLADDALFTPTQTGGGCRALEHVFPDGAYLLLTDDEAEIPESPDVPVQLGLYRADGTNVYWQKYANIAVALNDVDAFMEHSDKFPA